MIASIIACALADSTTILLGSMESFFVSVYYLYFNLCFLTPPPIHRGRGIVFDRFLCLCVSKIRQEIGWTDLHEIFMEGAE